MLNEILLLKEKQNSIKEFCSNVRQGIPSAIFGVNDSFKNYLVSVLDLPVLYVVKDFITAEKTVKQIEEFSNKKAIFLPASDELLLVNKAFSKDRLYQRICALDKLDDADVLVVTPETLMQSLPKSIDSFTLKVGETLQIETVVKDLVLFGYTRVESVESKGTFSLRGDLLDIYPIDSEFPIRVDFFGDEIENIKKFNVENRKSEGLLKEIKILSSALFNFKNDDINALYKIALDKSDITSKEQEVRRDTILSDLKLAIDNFDLDGMSILSPLSVDRTDIFGRLKKDTVIIFDESKRLNEIITLNQKEFIERYNSLYKAGEIFEFAKYNLLDVDEVLLKIKNFNLTAVQTLTTAIPFFNPLKIVNPQVSAIANYHLDFKEIFTDVERWLKGKYRVVIYTEDIKRAQKLSGEFSENGILSTINGDKLSGVNIISKKVSNGFVYHEEKVVLIGCDNLYAKRKEEKKLKSKNKGFFTAPEIGDYCVHETHGVGRVLGNKKISTTEGTKDYVAVEYYAGDVLYIPVEQMDILTRYLGSEKTPRLSKIGGGEFERVKRRVIESIKKMSFDLKKLYSERKAVKGFKFESLEELESAFISRFPFDSTVDQLTADLEIKADMESDSVMDRLVCGDVGFGKTEVAFRAVFRAIANGKQAVLLAPTTILTEQHFNTAYERFKDFGIRVAVLNRFKSEKEQKVILEKLKNGEIDFIIGTHRLLSRDVEFHDLGLLVLDEEQRFGVEHKEKIKNLKKDVDALTLTATPIPRTLHMSLSGIRSISTINTPPKKRLPVQTYVTEQTDSLIVDAIMKEVNRGGQAFLLYNRVDSIFKFSEHIQSLMPNLKITVAHGQMDEKTLEKNIIKFYQGETDLLISTTIIENGIDLPRANTMIVIDADKMGLSTLYQLKGRVGRSDRLAYAYFTFQRDKVLTSTAFERLNAIIEFAEMGSGIKIAMRDLEIRGAGNILGAEQHGHMDKIGYELYSKLLKEEMTGEEEKIPELDVRVSAFIPENYIESSSARMGAYKEIAEINGRESEKEFKENCKEVYGEIPQEVINLINISVVKRKAGKLGVSLVVLSDKLSFVEFENFKAFNNEKIIDAVSKFQDTVKISMRELPRLEFMLDGATNYEKLQFIRTFFDSMSLNK